MNLVSKILRLKFVDLIIIITFFLLIVFPNSFRTIKLPLLILLFLFSLNKLILVTKKTFLFYFLGVLTTVIYIIVGFLGDAKMFSESTSQVVFVYIISPIMWISICNYVLEKYSITTLIRGLSINAILGCLTVFIGIWLFDIGRLDLLEYIIDNPNKTIDAKGVIEMKLFVYGSLIFLIPAFFQLNKLYSSKIKFFVILLFLVTSIISGRSALLLSFFIGIFYFFISNGLVKISKYIFIGLIVFYILILFLEFQGINVLEIFDLFYKKVFESKDVERPKQFKALWDGVLNNIFGAGHGVGVDYIRSNKYPWRYEALPIATIFRVSILGFIIYSLPFLYSIYKFIKLKGGNEIDKFVLIGLISILISSFTNPYIESFEFNFFYVFPFIYFTKREL